MTSTFETENPYAPPQVECVLRATDSEIWKAVSHYRCHMHGLAAIWLLAGIATVIAISMICWMILEEAFPAGTMSLAVPVGMILFLCLLAGMSCYFVVRISLFDMLAVRVSLMILYALTAFQLLVVLWNFEAFMLLFLLGLPLLLSHLALRLAKQIQAAGLPLDVKPETLPRESPADLTL